MTAATADAIQEELVDILCADPDWVDSEFDQIVAGLKGAPPTAPVAPRPSSNRPYPFHVSGSGRSSTVIRSSRARMSIRSPPGAH